MKNLCNIIVIGYGPKVKRLDKQCISSILFNTKYPYILTYFDNYGSGLSLTQAWNILIKNNESEYVCLLNNDVVVTPNWLMDLIEVLGTNEDIGFVGPSGNCHSPQKAITSEEEAKKPEFSERIEILKDPPSAFCIIFRKATWEVLGGFDERYDLYGSESDLCDRAQKQLGCKFAWRQDVFIYHVGEQSSKAYEIDTELERKKARTIYWGDRGKKIK